MTRFSFKRWSLFLLLPYGLYCSLLYSRSLDDEAVAGELSQAGRRGRMLWAEYNCQSCHQLFKLGGYLGPELTHTLLEPGKSEAYAMAFMLTGTANMPTLGLSKQEAFDIARYLTEVAQSAAALRKQNPPYANAP